MQDISNEIVKPEKKSGNDLLEERIIAVKKRLPNKWKDILIARFPEYNTFKEGTRITNIMSCRAFDAIITERLESIANEFNPL